MCNDDSMQRICLINTNYVKDMRTLLEQTPILHYHDSPEQVNTQPITKFSRICWLRLHKLYLVCVIVHMAEHLEQVWPSTKDMGGNMPSLNVEEVLTAFKRDLLE